MTWPTAGKARSVRHAVRRGNDRLAASAELQVGSRTDQLGQETTLASVRFPWYLVPIRPAADGTTSQRAEIRALHLSTDTSPKVRARTAGPSEARGNSSLSASVAC
jgi:hypothetical protein